MNSVIHCIFKTKNWLKWLFLYISLKWTKLKYSFQRPVIIYKSDILQSVFILIIIGVGLGYGWAYYHYKNYDSVHMRILNRSLQRAEDTNRWLVETLCDRDVRIKLMEGNGKRRGKK